MHLHGLVELWFKLGGASSAAVLATDICGVDTYLERINLAGVGEVPVPVQQVGEQTDLVQPTEPVERPAHTDHSVTAAAAQC